jgi:hypothetical protein
MECSMKCLNLKDRLFYICSRLFGYLWILSCNVRALTDDNYGLCMVGILLLAHFFLTVYLGM